MKKVNKLPKCKPTPKQKLYGILGLIGFFVCGVMAGYAFGTRSDKTDVAPVCDCPLVASCQNNVGEVVEDANKPTCAIIEDIQTRWLNDVTSDDVVAHESNVAIYETLIKYGCTENAEKYRAALEREAKIIEALGGNVSITESYATCEQIEKALQQRLPNANNYVEDRIERAKIYANLSERGCPENSEVFVKYAKTELDIARALQDDEFDRQDTIEVVETYKRLNMQAAAKEFFDVAKKLTDPAIDFVLQVEKIINEQ